jgi:hypothetical protein
VYDLQEVQPLQRFLVSIVNIVNIVNIVDILRHVAPELASEGKLRSPLRIDLDGPTMNSKPHVPVTVGNRHQSVRTIRNSPKKAVVQYRLKVGVDLHDSSRLFREAPALLDGMCTG